MKIKYFIPLVLFIVPTIIASAVMWPLAAMQIKLIDWFAVMLLSMVTTYFSGIRAVLNDAPQPSLEVEK
jgi:hypothetical protein